MVPTLTRVTWKLKSLIEDKVNIDGSKIILTPYISKAALDIIGLVGENDFFFSIFYIFIKYLSLKFCNSIGFNYEFNSLTSPNELADAYCSLMEAPSAKHITISIL